MSQYKIGTKRNYQELKLVPSLSKDKHLEIYNQIKVQSTILVPVTIVQEGHPKLYLESGSVLTCRAFLNEEDAEFYLNMIAETLNIDPADLQFCPLPFEKLISSLKRISNKSQCPIVCMTMIKQGDGLQEAGIFWTNHEPFMV